MRQASLYGILPLTPIIGVLIFDGKWGPELHIITILVIFCMLLAAMCEFLRFFNAKTIYAGLYIAYKGMAEAFSSVVVFSCCQCICTGVEHHQLY